MTPRTTDRAKGKWRNILSEIGVASKALTGKHTPCPICGGKDRFRFLDTSGSGSWICSQHGSGAGMDLVMQVMDCDFRTAARRVDELSGRYEADKPRPAMSDAFRRKAMNDLWLGSRVCVKGDLVDTYLRGRGLALPNNLDVLRLCDRARAPDGTWHPTMVAMVHGVDGRPVTLHRTFLAPDGRKAVMESPRALMPGSVPDGSAIRLYKHKNRLGIAEGIETAIGAARRFRMPVWAAVNSTMLAKWIPPDGVDSVTVFGDNDPQFGGQASAYALAHKLSVRHGVSASVEIPEHVGKDWADV